MNRTLPTFRYLYQGFTKMTIIGFFGIMGSVIFTNLILYITDQYDGVRTVITQTVPADITASIFALVTGMVFFLINFKVVLTNGVSRKTFLVANLPAAALMAAGLAVFNLIVVSVHNLFSPIVMIAHLVYPGIHWAELLLVQIAQYFFWIVAGWFITLAYYRSSVLGRWAISLAPVAVFILYRLANALTGGDAHRTATEFINWTLYSSPSMAAASLLAYSILLVGLVYLMVRRAPLKG